MITSEPVDKEKAVGGSVKFEIKAKGAGPLIFKWKKDNGGLPSTAEQGKPYLSQVCKLQERQI